MSPPAQPAVLCFATQGPGSADEDRIRELLDLVSPELWPFERSRKARSLIALLREVRRRRPDVIVMEGTGVAGGLAVMAASVALGVPYVVSSGDAVGPFIRAHRPAFGAAASAYERLLYRLCAGFVGWSPYLVGRALTLGAPRAMTAANWAPQRGDREAAESTRLALNIPVDAVVFGLVGSLDWNRHRGYCYGWELVSALRQVDRRDIRVLIAGDGTGRGRLEELAGRELGRRVIMVGRVPREQVPQLLAAMDVGSLPQSVDRLGSFRYTTKISEYLAAGLPVVTGQVPLAYDLDDGWIWRLPGDAPWDSTYVTAMTELMQAVSRETVSERRARVPPALATFDKARQQHHASSFLRELVERCHSGKPPPDA
jgi:glycosyl transferase family 1